MRKYYKPRTNFLAIEDAVKMVAKDVDPPLLNEKDAQFCFGMSKMTLEVESKNIKSYTKMTVVSEFCEFIARVAELKYKEDGNLTLSEKVCEILQVLFTLIGANATFPESGAIEDESESDEDY